MGEPVLARIDAASSRGIAQIHLRIHAHHSPFWRVANCNWKPGINFFRRKLISYRIKNVFVRFGEFKKQLNSLRKQNGKKGRLGESRPSRKRSFRQCSMHFEFLLLFSSTSVGASSSSRSSEKEKKTLQLIREVYCCVMEIIKNRQKLETISILRSEIN